MSTHLGAVTSALIDGELGHDQREQVLAHLAHCVACRQQVDAERRFKTELRAMPVAPVPAALAERLLLLRQDVPPSVQPRLHRPEPRLLATHLARPYGRSPRLLPTRTAGPGAAGPGAAGPGAAGPGRGTGPTRPARRLRRSAVGGALLAMGLGGTLALGGPAPRGPSAPVNPTSPALVVDYTSTTPGVPFSDPDVVVASLITRR